MRNFVLAILTIAIVGIGFGCKSTKDNTTSGETSSITPIVEEGYNLSFKAIGHEPEWNVTVTHKEIIYKNINLKDSLLFGDIRSNVIMDIAGIGYTGVSVNGETILVQVIKVKCSDSMEDKEYSYKVDIQITNESEQALSGCGDYTLDARLANKWYLTLLNGNSIKAVNKDKRPYLTFDLDRKSVIANMGCNGIGGGYDVMENKIFFSPNFMSTLMYCEGIMDLEKEFSTAIIGKTLMYNLDNEKLMLYNMEHELVMVLSTK